MTIRTLSAAAIAAGALLASAHPAGASEVPADATWEAAMIRSSDGTPLQTDVFKPKDLKPGEKTPVILIVSAYAGGGLGVPATERPVIMPYHADFFEGAFKRGYSIVQVARRGYGASGGCMDYYGPGEQADAAAAIRWAAEQPWSTGKVGTYGGSDDGWSQVAQLAQRVPGHAAAVIQSPVSDQYRLHYMNRNPNTNGGIVVPTAYQSIAAYPAPPGSSGEEQSSNGQSNTAGPACAAEILPQAHNPDPDTAFWRERNLIPAASGTAVPTLWAAGFLDGNVQPDQVHDIYGSQRGPKRLWFAQMPHVPVSSLEEVAGRGGFDEEAWRWLDRYVKGVPASDAPVEEDPPVVVQEGYEGRWRTEQRWPPGDAAYRDLPLRPGSYDDLPGNKAEPGWTPQTGACARPEPACLPVPQGRGHWTFTRPFPHAAHIVGIPHLRVTVEQQVLDVNVNALVYDIDERNQALLITRGTFVSPQSDTLSFDLHPQDWAIKPGHRIGVLMTGADDGYFWHPNSGTRVRIAGALSLPFLTNARTSYIDGAPSIRIKERQSFTVDPSGNEVDWSFPPPFSTGSRALRPMRLKVRPTRTRADRKTHFCFRAYTPSGRRLRGVTIRLLGQQRRTDRRGHTGIDAAAPLPGRYVVEATKRGYRPVRRLVRVTGGR